LRLLKQHPRNNIMVNTSKYFDFNWSRLSLFFYSLRFSNLIDECFCIVESDPNVLHSYLIYSINNQTDEKILFGRLSYEISHYDNDYTYTIIIGQKLYRVRSSDLKYCRLTIIDTIQMNGNYSETLFELIDSFSKSNDKYHVIIHDKEWPLGYLALTILLHLHESQRNVF
jgi:hypothetical protein